MLNYGLLQVLYWTLAARFESFGVERGVAVHCLRPTAQAQHLEQESLLKWPPCAVV
jgi:hypothetical protein